MKTPFDSALRVQTRAMNAIRIALLAELAREHLVEAERAALASSIRHEATVAAVDWQLSAHPYGHYQRTERQRLDNDRRRIHANLDVLRGSAMDACGQMQAITEAAAGFATDRRLHEASAEQAQADDFSGARFSVRKRQSASSSR